jgi:hypothetical protein
LVSSKVDPSMEQSTWEQTWPTASDLQWALEGSMPPSSEQPHT